MGRDASRIVGIAELAVSVDPAETLVTYSLGSCIGLSLMDPVAGVGGLLHAMMPVSSMDPGRAAGTPGMFTDTGTLALLKSVFDRGATRANLVAKVAGAANQVDQHELFRIGERNLMILRRVLWKNDILISAEDCGGAISRTLVLEMATGRTLVKSNGTLRELQ
jgi:chemotaxis protein CheD